MTAVSDPQAAKDAGLDVDALDRLSQRIHVDVDRGQILGASVLVARGGVVAHREAIGQVAPGRTAALDDVYLLMSLSKAFTASLVLRAIDRGRLTLDTRAAEVLPAFGAGGKQRVTIRQLLTHTAGTYAGFLPPPPLTPAQMGDLEKNVAAVSAQPLANIPGERVVYNPFASYAVLGQILVATDPAGRSFRDIARQDLFEPLGMSNTSYGLSVDAPRRVPVSFTEANTTPATPALAAALNALDEHAELPAGGGFSTVDDVFRFAETLRRHGDSGSYRLLSPALFDYAARSHTGDLSNGAWDFNREAQDIPDFPANFSLLGGYVRGEGHYLTSMGHTATPRSFCAVGGGSTFWMVDPARDFTVVFLSAGFIEGLAHMRRLQQLGDLALAAVQD